MKATFRTVAAAVTAAIAACAIQVHAVGFNAPIVERWAGPNTAGSFTWTNSTTSSRQAISSILMSAASHSATSLGQTNSIWMTFANSTNWHELASSVTATNTLMFNDGTGALPLEPGARIRFQWSNTNATIQFVIVTRSAP